MSHLCSECTDSVARISLKVHIELFEGCCYKKWTGYCCWVTLGFGCLFLLLGVVALIAGNSLLTKAILKTMALKPDSDRLQSWLTPPVQPHLEGRTFPPPLHSSLKKPISRLRFQRSEP